MNTQERKTKILEVARDNFMTVAEIGRAAFGRAAFGNAGQNRRCRELIMEMLKEGEMERGEDALLANNTEVSTYRAAPGAAPGPSRDDVFHGRAPSVFEWRGNFGLRSTR